MVDEIGTAAGVIYRYLEHHGPASLSALQKETGLPTPRLHEGLGWLGREGKIAVEKEGRVKKIRLVGS